jgi:hypothetical protein
LRPDLGERVRVVTFGRYLIVPAEALPRLAGVPL